jgi:hypothetical protein
MSTFRNGFFNRKKLLARLDPDKYVLLVLALVIALSLPARAQAQARVRRIGFLGNSTPTLRKISR